MAVRGGARRRWQWALVLLVAALAAAVGGGSAEGDPVCQTSWTAGNGQFTTAANWSAGVPNGSTHGCINLSVTVTLTGTASTSGVTVGTGSTLAVSSGSDLNLGATGLVSDGTVRLQGGSAELDARGGATIENRGLLVVEGSGVSFLLGGTVLNTDTIDVDAEVRTEGTWTNTGTINVDGDLVDHSNTSITLGSGSQLTGPGDWVWDNSGNWTWAGTGGTITMANPPRVSSHTFTFTDTGAGTVELFGANTVLGTIGANQTVRVSSGAEANTGASTLTNNGTVRLLSGPNNTELDFRGGGTFH
ncbi:MAG TPA: hypothetical protein VD926_14650, partial [Acidimicrobiales bacterium]|nr:hypothetical protein [Acidimicrobiales bacterium]